MVPGEDVADFHLRIEITDRVPVLVPLGSATFNINGVETNEPIRTIVGDVVTVGQATMQIGFEVEMEGTHYEWLLVADSGEETPIIGEIAVGRAIGADVTINDAHISRFHARFLERKGFIWIQDLGSSNGTRVNTEKARGGVRLYHGDQISFDRYSFQLVGRGGDLTPVTQFESPELGSSKSLPPTPRVANPNKPSPVIQESGTALVSEDGRSISPLSVGDNTVGSSPECTVFVQHSSIHDRHVRLDVTADGMRLTHLTAPGLTQVNGTVVDTVILQAGDKIQLGDVVFCLQVFESPVQGWQNFPSILKKYELTVGGAIFLVAMLISVLLLS